MMKKMIIINGKNFDNASKKVSFGEYSVTQDGKKRNGSAPFISFKFDNIFLGPETIYDKKWLKELKINSKIKKISTTEYYNLKLKGIKIEYIKVYSSSNLLKKCNNYLEKIEPL